MLRLKAYPPPNLPRYLRPRLHVARVGSDSNVICDDEVDGEVDMVEELLEVSGSAEVGGYHVDADISASLRYRLQLFFCLTYRMVVDGRARL